MAPKPQKLMGACGFCHQREHTPDSGILYKTADGKVAAHFNCMLFSPLLVSQASEDGDSFGGFLLEDVKKEIKRGSRLRCNSCKQSGATAGCDVSICKRSYHYLCALKCKAGVVEDEKNGIYKIFCARHKPGRDFNEDEENADDSNEALTSTDDEISFDGADDDATCEDDYENDASFRHAESGSYQPCSPEELPSTSALSPQGNKSDVLDTPKRNMLKRPKTSSPQVVLEKETNCGYRHLDFSGNAAAAGPSGVNSNSLKSEDTNGVLDIEQSSASKRKRISVNSDSSESSSSKFGSRPVKRNYEESRAVPCTVNDRSPQWRKLLSQCYPQIKTSSDDPGQTNMRKGRDFWNLCREANCVEALLEKMKASVESNIESIQHQNASDEDYEQAFNVLKATGCLQNVARDIKQEIKDQKEAIEREKENLLREEKMLDEIEQVKF